jgi:hypothetical protein
MFAGSINVVQPLTMDSPQAKRRRVSDADKSKLVQLLETRQWSEAIDRVRSHPQEVTASTHPPSPLALACRSGAPYECVKAILDASPESLRHVLDARGAPLHEAIVCETASLDVIAALLRTDEALGPGSTRATLLQDVDGFTPLHLLIRRRFQMHMLQGDDTSGPSLMEFLELLVSSCPEAIVVPDRGEYEEPPIIYALKANIFVPSLVSEDAACAKMERQIYEMVECMLKYNPAAASQVFTGYRGQYTAMHSAVFHGRHMDTINLLIKTEQVYPSMTALLANTQGELPLHFCAMRGERPRTMGLIAQAAPQAVCKRDTSGLTPFHWLWVRFFSTLLSLDGGQSDASLTMDAAMVSPFETNQYNVFTSLEKGDFDHDLQLIKRMDPPVDFLRMRHIPPEMIGARDDTLHWAQRAVQVLQETRARFYNDDPLQTVVWTRRQVVVGLFWNKVVSLLSAASRDGNEESPQATGLVHAAFRLPCCPPAVCHIVASLFPDELNKPDPQGRLPIHHACRHWHSWDWARDDDFVPTAAKLLHNESLHTVRTALELSSPQALQVADKENRLPLHHAIDTFTRASTRAAGRSQKSPLLELLSVLKDMVNVYPESLQQRDGRTKLYPFMQATAVATEQEDTFQQELPLSITFELLRGNPTVIPR